MIRIKIIGVLFIALALKSYAQETKTPTPQWRPVYHFSPPTNWTNDPNGLIVLNGEFQLYYQHNPFENKWGHMSWGHATSTDLINWKNLPVAIPEVMSKDTTTWIYSGSVVEDKNNTSGFGTNGKPPLVAIFTADQPKQKKESQFIAYSLDNGLTYKQYAANPVIDLNKRDFRDPNVFWHEPTKQWIMTVAMVDEHMVRIYGSKNLKEWTKLSDFGPSGYTRNGWECPSLLPITVDNDPQKTKWVLFVSCGGDHGPLMQYYVGDFDGTTFKNDNSDDKVLTVDYGDAFYAAIAWRDAPANKKLLIGWLQNGKQETYPWKGQMSIPHDLTLKTTEEGVRLFQDPPAMLSKGLSKVTKGSVLSKKNIDVDNKAITLSKKGAFDSNSIWIEAEFLINDSKKVGFNVVANNDQSKKVVVGYDAEKQQLFIDCSSSERENKQAVNLVQTAPMKAVNGVVKMKVLVDKSSLEVFGNDGEKVISTMIYPDKDATGVSVFAEGKATLKDLRIRELK
ncbi:glycoside hydrolase family 32 protein [Mucilaginibacter sabulilitoris]|uniref:Glycoside hydrolase family 32 protein n=1 Tax=Mucilaginibacter sabulilitoris TaxID=1173583 RepID=A0ABZ0TJA9_9SPHI|nr:glycoside hydrolase family 32 protein [Mucilaginibacter sabulilitoris]WPU92766.1 glycoside hydrolase family 32 protein [Mucilaginibacter sabulilitoris]